MGQNDDVAAASRRGSVRPAALLIVRITPADIGRRVTIRHRISADATTLTDVMGHLRSLSDGLVVIERHDGELIEIAETAMVAAKVIPPKAVRPERPTTSQEGNP